MSNVLLKFSGQLAKTDPSQNPVLIVGQLRHLTKVKYDLLKLKLEPRVSEETYTAAVNNLMPSPTDSCSLWLTNATIAALPSKCSRHNTPSRAHSLTRIIRSCIVGGDEYIVIICEKNDVFASACAAARAFPLFSRKSNLITNKRTVTVEFVLVNGGDSTLTDEDVSCLTDACLAIRKAARITDSPCAEMHTRTFLEEVRDVGRELNIEPTVIIGEELREKGFGGLYGVGKAATNPPMLLVLSHMPEGATKTIAWVGKGIMYDTGGLSIKGKTTMPGMKRDCGGAASVLGAFQATVKQGFTDNLHAIFCLAENAVGPESLRPDDILTLYSGRTVEVSNTDAEGRLVLGDGVAYAVKDLKAEIIVDLATLTGAQGLATGRFHGAVISNNEDWESHCVVSGQLSGDLVHPLVYCPELHFNEFASAVADMKNSSADRSNAEVSCAGLFIASHVGFYFPGSWVHIDMAYPVYSGERATGYGVALLMVLFRKESRSKLLQSLSFPTIDGMVNEESASKKIRLS